MMGSYRLVKDDKVIFYELQTIVEQGSSLVFRLKHFNADLSGWEEKQADAVQLFRRNLRQFPDEYIPNESLADALWFLDEREEAIGMFEAWLEKHPGHDMARRRLATLRERL